MRLRRFLSAVLVAVLVSFAGLSCGDNLPTASPTPSPSPLLIGDLLSGVGLLKCTPLPYASASKAIGPAGGSLQVGPHTLRIPAGALSQTVTIRAEAPSDVVNSVRLYPEGLQFGGTGASLTMSYANCNLLGRILPKRIAYTTEGLQILSYLLSLDNLLQKNVTGQLRHFSRYAVAW
jgi:hypothetical protein